MNGYIENDDKNKHISLVFFFLFPTETFEEDGV